MNEAYAKSAFKVTEAKGAPIIIHSDIVEIDNKKGVVVFLGNVNAKSEDFTIECKRMTLYYIKKKGRSSSKGVIVDRIVAVQDVRIKRRIGGEARADRAEYYNRESKIVLTGNPIIKHGGDFIEGEKITFYLKDDRSVVEGSSKEKVRAVFSSPSDSKLR
jgi:lipopolysaccharide export system protein LptA